MSPLIVFLAEEGSIVHLHVGMTSRVHKHGSLPRVHQEVLGQVAQLEKLRLDPWDLLGRQLALPVEGLGFEVEQRKHAVCGD